MHYIDIVVLVLLVAFGVKGMIRGLIKELFTTVGVVLGVFLGSNFAPVVGKMIPLGSASTGVVNLVGFALVFVAVYALCFLLGFMFADYRFMKERATISTQIHAIGGAVIGAIKLFLILSIVVFAFGSTKKISDLMQSKFASSISFPILQTVGSKIIKLDIDASIGSVKDEAQKMVDDISHRVVGDEMLKGK